MSLHLARVVEVLPEQGGVRVLFEDLVRSGFAGYDFVRVLQPKMSAKGGAMLWLPEVDELGVVGKLDGGYYVWLGALPFLDKNQVDPTPGILYLRHQSGVTMQVRENGDFEVAHPSGFRLTVAEDIGPLDPLLRTSLPTTGNTTPPCIEIDHPSGLNLGISADGGLSIAFPSGSGLEFAEDGSVNVNAAGDCSLSAGGNITVFGADSVAVNGTSGVTVTTVGDCMLSAGGDIHATAGGDFNVESDSKLKVNCLKGVELTSLMGVTIVATTNISITATAALSITSMAALSLTSSATITITAPAIGLMGAGTLNTRNILTS